MTNETKYEPHWTEEPVTRPNGSGLIVAAWTMIGCGLLAILVGGLMSEISDPGRAAISDIIAYVPPTYNPWKWPLIWLGSGATSLGITFWALATIVRALFFLPGRAVTRGEIDPYAAAQSAAHSTATPDRTAATTLPEVATGSTDGSVPTGGIIAMIAVVLFFLVVVGFSATGKPGASATSAAANAAMARAEPESMADKIDAETDAAALRLVNGRERSSAVNLSAKTETDGLAGYMAEDEQEDLPPASVYTNWQDNPMYRDLPNDIANNGAAEGAE